jgi:4,5-DOPA dioxygenase extradiol
VKRRDLLRGIASVPLLACSRGEQAKPAATTSARMPSLFLAHGAPPLLDDATWMGELAGWAQKLPRPRSILVVSAHWEHAPVTLGATTTVPLVYDFYGFPQRYYDMTYAAPGAPELAARVRQLVPGTADAPSRGLDHGAYTPLMAMYPQHDVPVLQLSIPSLDPSSLLALGRALAPLRDEGVLVMGSGFLTHNLRALRSPSVPSWASELDAWAAEKLAKRDVDAMLDYRAKAPGVAQALPTHEHFVPVLLALGTSIDRDEKATFPITGWVWGPFTKRSVQFG